MRCEMKTDEIVINVREMVEADGEFVLEIRNDDSTRSRLHNPSKFTLDQFSCFYKSKSPWWLIVSCDGEDFGYFRTDYVDRKNKSIQVGMDIHPNHRGKGLAKPSYKKLFDHLKAEGFEIVWLEVLKSNTLAHDIYKKLDFTETNRVKYGEDESIRMERLV